MLKFEIRSDLNQLMQKFDFAAGQSALETAVIRSCDPFVPYNTGELAGSAVSANGEVQYTAGHAAECYYGNRAFNRKKHPRACARWFEAAKAVSIPEWKAAVAAAVTGGRQK